MSEESIQSNNLKRISPINEAMFNITYNQMCEDVAIERIYMSVIACMGDEDNYRASNWIPSHLISFIKKDQPQGWLLQLAITPAAAVKYLVCESGVVSMECRIAGKITTLHIPTDQIVQLVGVKQQMVAGKAVDELIDMQWFPFYIHSDTDIPESEQQKDKPQTKRPVFTVVK